mgnify:CR=1 FL=1
MEKDNPVNCRANTRTRYFMVVCLRWWASNRWNSIYQLVCLLVVSCCVMVVGHGQDSVMTMESVLRGGLLGVQEAKGKAHCGSVVVT